jgi:hypothetical protein
MNDMDFYDVIDQNIDELSAAYKNNEHLKKQSENNKKSFLFLFWFLGRYLPNKDLSEVESFVTDGNDDSSCDLIFNNQDQQGNDVYYVVQAKWFIKSNVTGSKGITGDIKSCLTDFRLVVTGKKESKVNSKFNEQYQKFLVHKKNNGRIKFIFLMLSKADLDINEYIEDFAKPPLLSFELIDFSKLKHQYIEIEYKGIKTHNPIESPYIPQSKFQVEFEKKQVIHIKNPFESYIFLVKPKQIYELFEKYGHSLFYKNIRNPLSRSFFNEGIKKTILENAVNFWYFNNGITAITSSIEPFYEDSTNATITGIQVINGAQTVFSLHFAYKYASEEQRKKIDDNALVTFRIVKSGGDDFDLKVTRYTNSQNPVLERDFHANDDVQQRLQSDFLKKHGIWYETRRGEFRKKPKNVTLITNEQFAQAYLAYFINNPFLAKQSKKLIFVSYSIDQRGLYETIFNEHTNCDDMLISHSLLAFVDEERKRIKKEIATINTANNLTQEEKALLMYDFIQYSNFEVMALFKVLLFRVNEDNTKGLNGKVLNALSGNSASKLQQYYVYIIDFILSDLNERKSVDFKIVNSVLFKNKDYYSSLKEKFEEKIGNEKNHLKSYIL